MYADHYFDHTAGRAAVGLDATSGLSIYRTRNRRLEETTPLSIATNRPSEALHNLRSIVQSTRGAGGGQEEASSSGDLLPLSHFRYGRVDGNAMNAAFNLDDTPAARAITLNSRASPTAIANRSSYRSSSQLCRCGSGGALPGQSVVTAFDSVSSPTAILAPASNFRTVQSLPSTPHTNRRPVSPTLASAVTGTPTARSTDHRGLPVGQLGYLGPSRPEFFRFETNCNESSALAPNIENGRSSGGQRVPSRFRSSSTPLAKLSSLIIVLLAIIIIGFIVLSPVFHYFM